MCAIASKGDRKEVGRGVLLSGKEVVLIRSLQHEAGSGPVVRRTGARMSQELPARMAGGSDDATMMGGRVYGDGGDHPRRAVGAGPEGKPRAPSGFRAQWSGQVPGLEAH